MSASRTVAIDILPDSVYHYADFDAIVCIDVILDSTLLVTAAAAGRRALALRGLDQVLALFTATNWPLLYTEGAPAPKVRTSGLADLVTCDNPARAMVAAGSPGAELIAKAAGARALYVACLRNVSATLERLAARYQHVALIGAGSSGEYRCEDQMVAAWIGRRLLGRGFVAHSLGTTEAINRWGEADAALAGWGKSAEELRRRGWKADLDLVLSCVDDLPVVCTVRDGEVVVEPEGDGVTRRAGSAA
jgi:hypothetical protein